MDIGHFLKSHAGNLASIADSLAIILGGLGIHPHEAAKVHQVIGALKDSANEIHNALDVANNPPETNPVELITQGASVVNEVKSLLA